MIHDIGINDSIQCMGTVAGRTGRFGRKGVAILFVHDQQSWQEMHEIELELDRPITRIDTSDFDDMEEVSVGEQRAWWMTK